MFNLHEMIPFHCFPLFEDECSNNHPSSSRYSPHDYMTIYMICAEGGKPLLLHSSGLKPSGVVYVMLCAYVAYIVTFHREELREEGGSERDTMDQVVKTTQIDCSRSYLSSFNTEALWRKGSWATQKVGGHCPSSKRGKVSSGGNWTTKLMLSH